MARNIAPGANVTAILSPNTDPHEYEVRPDDVKALASADIVLRSGGEVDAVARRRARRRGRGRAGRRRRRRARPGSRATTRTGGRTRVRAEKAAAAIGRAFAARRPAGPLGGVRRAAEAARRGRAGAAWTACRRRSASSSPRHDALGYYARRYGIQVIGTVIPALTTAAQPSAGDVAKLVATIKRDGREDDLRRELREPEGRGGDRARDRREDRQGAVGGLARAEGLRRRDVHRLDRVQHARAGAGLHAAARSTARSMPDLARALHPARDRRDPAARGDRGRARDVGRAAAAAVLHARDRHRDVPGPRRRRARGACRRS